MPADTTSGTVTTIKSSEAFYGTPHLLPVDAEGVVMLVENSTLNDWMLPIIILGLLFFSVAWYYFSPQIKQNLKAVFSWRFFYLVDKEEPFFRATTTYLLFGSFLVAISLLIYQTLQFFDLCFHLMTGHPVLEYAIILLSVLLFYPLKLLLVSFFAWVFSTARASYMYFVNIFMVNNLFGLLLLPLVFYNAFNPSKELLLLMWGLWLIFNVYKVIRGAYMANRESGFYAYYLFLYLCAVELAPLFVIVKAVAIYLPGIAGVIISY